MRSTACRPRAVVTTGYAINPDEIQAAVVTHGGYGKLLKVIAASVL